MKKLAPHALFVHCHCHILQLACVQAANETPGIKHVYVTLTPLWTFFHYSPKRTESLKEFQKRNTMAAIFLLDYTLPQVAKLSKTLQTENLDLSIISSLVDATLHTLDDAVLPAANWVLELLDKCEDLEKATGVKITSEDIKSFQETAAKPFIAHLKNNISSQFSSSGDVLSAFSIFDRRKVPSNNSEDLSSYGEDSIKTLVAHYGVEKTAGTLQGEEKVKEKIISDDVTTEWKTFQQFMSKANMKLQLKGLVTNDMLTAMFPNLSTLGNICLSIPVSTTSVERSFSQMKLLKTHLRNHLSDSSLSHLMKIAIESPDKLSDSEYS